MGIIRRRSRVRARRIRVSPLIETLRIIERRISEKVFRAKSIKQFRKDLTTICNDDQLWKDVTNLTTMVKKFDLNL